MRATADPGQLQWLPARSERGLRHRPQCGEYLRDAHADSDADPEPLADRHRHAHAVQYADHHGDANRDLHPNQYTDNDADRDADTRCERLLSVWRDRPLLRPTGWWAVRFRLQPRVQCRVCQRWLRRLYRDADPDLDLYPDADAD